MEIFVLLMVGAIGGFWWLNYVMKKNAEKANETAAPYKVEPTPVVTQETTLPSAPVEQKPAEPVAVVETKVVQIEASPVKKPRKPKTTKAPVKKPATASKAVVRKPKKA